MYPLLKTTQFYRNLQEQKLDSKIRFNISDACTESLTIEELSALIDEDVAATVKNIPLNYASIQGNELLREQIAKYYPQAAAKDIVVFAGAQEAIYCCMANRLKPGDEVIVFEPCYPSLAKVPLSLGAKVISFPIRKNNHWYLDLVGLKKLVNERTKLIVINQPHNPTGLILNTHEIAYLQNLVEKHNIYLLSDEVSLWSDYQQLGLPSSYLPTGRIISLGVTSKSLGLAGIRIGWSVCSDPIFNQDLLKLKSYFSICCSIIDETIACMALRSRDKILAKNNAIIDQNTRYFSGLLTKYRSLITWDAPVVGVLSLMEITNSKELDCDALVEDLINTTGILLLPAYCFGLEEANVFRIGLGKKAFSTHASLMLDYFKTTL